MRSSMAEAGDRKTAPVPRPSHGPGPPRPHPPHGIPQGPRNYKTLYDKELGAKETIRRYNGHIPGHPKYDVKLPLSDPRNHYIQFRTVAQADLPVPSFTVDRNTIFYPKVEVAMFELNDNVNKNFLQQLANKIATPIDIDVFYHPITKKHMGMAMIVFPTYDEAHRFVLEYNGKTVMGSQVSCHHDPYFTLLSQRYEDATGEEMRVPVHLKGLEETILNTRRSQYAKMNEELHKSHASTSSLPSTQLHHKDAELDMSSVSLVDVLQRSLERRTPCTPNEVSTPVRRSLTPVRPRTPLNEPPFSSAPASVPLPTHAPPPPPPAMFMPHIPPPMIPPFHPVAQIHANFDDKNARNLLPRSALQKKKADLKSALQALGNGTFGAEQWPRIGSEDLHNLSSNYHAWNHDTNTSCDFHSENTNRPSAADLWPRYKDSRKYHRPRSPLYADTAAHSLWQQNALPTGAHSGTAPHSPTSREHDLPSSYRLNRARASFGHGGFGSRYRDRRPYRYSTGYHRNDDHWRNRDRRDCRRRSDFQTRFVNFHRGSNRHHFNRRRGNFTRRRVSPVRETYTDKGLIIRRYHYRRTPVNQSSPGNSGSDKPSEPFSPPPRKKSRWDDPELCTSQAQPGPSNAPPMPPMPPMPPIFGMAYPPPPPYSAVPEDAAAFPPGYSHPPPTTSAMGGANEGGASTSHETAETRRGRKSGKSSKKKKKKRKRHSSASSSSSSSSSSLNIGEYLRVEKKEMSTKYISREREGRVVEEIKTVTKRKKYMVTEKRNDIKQTPGLQKISSDESEESREEGKRMRKEKTPSPSKLNEKKAEGHRWSSSSTESEVELHPKKEKKIEKTLSAASSLHDLSSRTPVPPVVVPPPPPSVFSPGTPLPQPAAVAAPILTLPPPPPGIPIPPPPLSNLSLPPTHLPPPPFPLPPPLNAAIPMGAPGFPPLLPPPTNFCAPPPQPFVKRDFPKVSLRFVEDSPSQSSPQPGPSHQTLADRVASIFGADTLGEPSNARPESSVSQRQGSSDAACADDVDDMDVDIGSSPESMSLSPLEPLEPVTKEEINQRKRRRKTGDKQKRHFLRNVALVAEATEKTIGEEIVDVVTKDFYKRVEGVSFEILEEVLAELRHELEEQKRNEAQEALRAQAQIVTQEKPSDVAQFCNPLDSLNSTPEKLGAFPFTINMPKLPSFRRKVRPPSPESESDTRSPLIRRHDDDSDNSDAAHKSSSSSQNSSESSDEVVIHRRKRVQRLHSSSSVSGSESSSDLSSSESVTRSSKSSRTRTSALKEDVSSMAESSVAISSASSIASSSESTTSSGDEAEDLGRDASTATEEPPAPAVVEEPVVQKIEPPLWEKILGDSSSEWSETLLQSRYHVNLSEHCYFKLPESEEKDRKPSADVAQADTTTKDKENNEPASQKKKPKEKVGRELLGLLDLVETRPPKPPKPEIVYPPWTEEEKIRHIFNWECCFDPEDQEYLKLAWLELQPQGDDAKPPWKKPVRFNFASWADKPRLLDAPRKKGRLDVYFEDDTLDGILPIKDGCARTRGYFKLTAKEKRSLIRRPEDEQRDKTVINERDEALVRHNLVSTKESRSMHRRLLTTMGDANTDFFKVNQLKYRKKMIKFARSRIHGWGLYAMETIAPDDMIVEYVGQKVRNTVADVREKAYERRGIGSSYLFRIDDTTVIDATRMGNFARFINHSCQPNCYAKVVTVDGDKRIVIYSKTLINKGDEITYDYKFPIEDDKVDCLCGAPNCRGTLN